MRKSAWISLSISFVPIVPRFWPIKRLSNHRVSICVAKAFVLATPYSMPALVKSVASAVRTIEELSTLQIAKVFIPPFCAIFVVSSVSPGRI